MIFWPLGGDSCGPCRRDVFFPYLPARNARHGVAVRPIDHATYPENARPAVSRAIRCHLQAVGFDWPEAPAGTMGHSPRSDGRTARLSR